MKKLFTTDDFIGGQIKLKQTATGYRATSDAILLASSIEPKDQDTILDVGTGTGIIAICIAKRYIKSFVTGIDIQAKAIALAKENAKINQLEKNTDFIQCDIGSPTKDLKSKSFDFVITNPPYATESDKSPNISKSIANHESANITLGNWLDFCIKRLKPKGTLTLIHRADRLDEIINILSKRMGKITIYPLYPMKNKPAKRIIITAVKNSHTPISLMPGLIIHKADGSPTATAEKILRQGCILQKVV